MKINGMEDFRANNIQHMTCKFKYQNAFTIGAVNPINKGEFHDRSNSALVIGFSWDSLVMRCLKKAGSGSTRLVDGRVYEAGSGHR